MFDWVIVGEGLRLLKATRIDCGSLIFAGFMGGIDKLAGDPVCANYCETYHKGLQAAKRDSFVNLACPEDKASARLRSLL